MYFHLERFKGCLLSMSKLHDFHTSKSSLKFTKKFIFHGHKFFIYTTIDTDNVCQKVQLLKLYPCPVAKNYEKLAIKIQ